MFPALNHDPRRHGTEDLRDLRAEQVAIHPASQLGEVATRLAHPQHEGTHEPHNGGRDWKKRTWGTQWKNAGWNHMSNDTIMYIYIYIYYHI